jgi:uncharacterized protein (DUF427 family)
MTAPDNGHPLDIRPNPNRIRVVWQGEVIADTTRALDLKEASYPVVCYIPREDVAMERLRRTERTTRCPYKGDANYYSIASSATVSENAVWTYEHPIAAVAAIAGHLAFYPDKVRFDETPA